jgi:hypothetical protein
MSDKTNVNKNTDAVDLGSEKVKESKDYNNPRPYATSEPESKISKEEPIKAPLDPRSYTKNDSSIPSAEWTVTLEVSSHLRPTELAIMVHMFPSVEDVRVVNSKRRKL